MHELKLLWDGVVVFDAYSNGYFNMRAVLRCTINDFPAYAMLSGWSTKGYKACSSCADSTHSYMFGGKICCLGHQRWLPCNHPYRSQGHLFDGTEEFRDAPVVVDGIEISVQQDGVGFVYGKSKKASKKKKERRQIGTSTCEIGDDCDKDYDVDATNDVLWTKRSIFFELPYWKVNRLRHNLDIMHIEKNVCNNLLGILLNVDKKLEMMRM